MLETLDLQMSGLMPVGPKSLEYQVGLGQSLVRTHDFEESANRFLFL